MKEKPPVISARAVEKWVEKKQGSMDKYTQLTITRAEAKEAQRDADAAHYEPIISEFEEIQKAQMVLEAKLNDTELAIQQARQETAREIFEKIEKLDITTLVEMMTIPREQLQSLKSKYLSKTEKDVPEREGG